MFENYDRLALPVVDKDNKMLGILTVDDVMDVARASATHDIQKLGGMESLDAPYFSVRLREMLAQARRLACVLFLGEMLTATAMSHFQAESPARSCWLCSFLSSSAAAATPDHKLHLCSFVPSHFGKSRSAIGGEFARVRSCLNHSRRPARSNRIYSHSGLAIPALDQLWVALPANRNHCVG